jgi:hypothetical protein
VGWGGSAATPNSGGRAPTAGRLKTRAERALHALTSRDDGVTSPEPASPVAEPDRLPALR